MSNIISEMDHIKEHFKRTDPILYEYILRYPLTPLVRKKNLFDDLCRSIVDQQLSVKAGAVIYGRFEKLFEGSGITPDSILLLTHEQIRACGVSNSKVKSLKDLSKKIVEGDLDLGLLNSLSDEDVITKLSSVYGIGKWTAEMFLISSLARENVFSYGDVGLLRAFANIYGHKKPPTIKQIERVVNKWSPYKSFASVTLWRSLDNKPF